jgi:hypothetical protein
VADSEVPEVAGKLLNYIVGLGANSVAISFPIYTDGLSPTKVYAKQGETPTPSQLGAVIVAAKARDLRVSIRPLIDQKSLSKKHTQGWRGELHPKNVQAWFASYDKLLLSYVAVAKKDGANEFVAGTELASLQSKTSEWKHLSKLLHRAGFSKVISYAESWDNWTSVPFKTIGIDAYPDVNLGDSATIRQLTNALTRWFNQHLPAQRSRLSVQEIGIPAQDGMYRNPWKWGSQHAACRTLNLAVQAKWFSAACSAVKATRLQGIYYWMLDSNTFVGAYSPASEPSGWFYGRPAAASIKHCFSS